VGGRPAVLRQQKKKEKAPFVRLWKPRKGEKLTSVNLPMRQKNSGNGREKSLSIKRGFDGLGERKKGERGPVSDGQKYRGKAYYGGAAITKKDFCWK